MQLAPTYIREKKFSCFVDFDVGVNESIFFSFVCPMTHMNAQKCY